MTSKYIENYSEFDDTIGGDASRDHPDNDAWSDRTDATRWFILPWKARSVWVKVKRDTLGFPYISEVVYPLNQYHLPLQAHAVLPASYKPYADKQWYALVPEGSRGFHLTEDVQLWFFGLDSPHPGVELRNDKADVVTPIPALRRCKLNESLKDGFELGFLSEKKSALPSDEGIRHVYLISGSPGVGKSTLVKKMNQAGVPAVDGDQFGYAVRKERTLLDKYRRWMMSELQELRSSEDPTDSDDALLDAFGLAATGLSIIGARHMLDEASDSFFNEQLVRGRPEHWWYSLIQQSAVVPHEEHLRLVHMLASRYNDRYTDEPFIWDMKWTLDVDLVLDRLNSGISVAVVGDNMAELLKRVKSYDWRPDIKVNVIYLTCPQFVVKARLQRRAESMKGDPRFPLGIHDIIWGDIAESELDRRSKFESFGATFVYDRSGKHQWETVRAAAHLS